MAWKIPESVLVVIHAGEQYLLLERADRPGFWQSVTGSLDAADEPLVSTCRREVFEETGLDRPESGFRDLGITNRYEIFARWRHRYAPGVTHNTEHVFALDVGAPCAVQCAPREHLGFVWVGADEAIRRCFSPSNAAAIAHVRALQGWARARAAEGGDAGAAPATGETPG